MQGPFAASSYTHDGIQICREDVRSVRRKLIHDGVQTCRDDVRSVRRKLMRDGVHDVGVEAGDDA